VAGATVGSAVLHHQDVWHGSAANASSTRHRRALGIHLLRQDLEFVDNPGYIYGRYQLAPGSKELSETFFPTTFDPAAPLC